MVGASVGFREEKKRQIQRAALLAFSRKGYHRTTMRDIADFAGIGKSTIYEYFESKEELFLSLIDFAGSQFLENIKKAVKDIRDPLAALKKILNASTQSYRDWRDFLRLIILFFGETTADRELSSPKFIARLKNFYEILREELRLIVERGIEEGIFRDVDPQDVSSFLIALIDGLSFHWLIEELSPDERKRCNRCFFNLTLEGLLKDRMLEAGG